MIGTTGPCKEATLKDESMQKKDYDIETIFKLLLLNPILDLDKAERKASNQLRTPTVLYTKIGLIIMFRFRLNKIY